MKIKREDRQGVVVLRLKGDLTGGPRTSQVLEKAVQAAIAENRYNVLLI